MGGEFSLPTWVFTVHVPVGSWFCGEAGSCEQPTAQLLVSSSISSSSTMASLYVGPQTIQQANEMQT